MLELTTAEQLLYSTVKINGIKGKNITGSGTGFFMLFALQGETSIPCIVTNKHVIKDCDSVIFRCHFAENDKPSGRFVNCTVTLAPGAFVEHPENIDLCLLPFGDIMNQAKQQNTPLFLTPLTLDLVPSDQDWQYFDAMEEVLMIGCPNGISDEFNNLPISRRGITASSMTKDYNGKPEFLVDMACFPGSSGSPIFVYDRNGFLDRKTNSYNIGASRIHLVGILYSGPLITNDGQIILSHLPRVQVASMMHLGNAIKASQLNVLDKLIREKMIIKQPDAKIQPAVE